MDIQLFLAHANNHKPVLPKGIPPRNVLHTLPLVSAPPGSKRLIGATAPSDSLPGHRWGIVAPKGEEGDRLLALIERLREKRAQEQGTEPKIYRVAPGMDPSASASWIQRDYLDEVDRDEERLPRYLLILGGPELVSWNLQQLLGGAAFVGRLSFPHDSGYETYIDKVLKWEKAEPEPGAHVLFHTVRDGTSATTQGYQELMGPSLEIVRDAKRRGKLLATDIVEIANADGVSSTDQLRDRVHSMLRAAESSRAGVLFSMSHGAGAPRTGWRSLDEQRANQGAMVIGPGDHLTSADVAGRPFLPGGLWLFFACFSAGTPAHSAYYPWLERLHDLGYCGPARRVLAALPKPDEPPFVAALPQAALANPDGPLGVIGHVDLAWTWSFLEHDFVPGSSATHRRADRFQGILRALAGGHRLGVAHYELARFSRGVGAELLTLYGENARHGIPIDDATESEIRKAKRAGLWMQFQDLSAYVLLGDPAARLPIAQYPAGLSAPGPIHGAAGRAAPRGARTFSSMEEAVVAQIRGLETPAAIAARNAITEAELERWVNAFFDGGRPGLRKLL